MWSTGSGINFQCASRAVPRSSPIDYIEPLILLGFFATELYQVFTLFFGPHGHLSSVGKELEGKELTVIVHIPEEN